MLGAHRERARDDEEEEQGSRCRLLRKAKEASIREPQLDDEEEREARENKQWRSGFSRDDWGGGVGEGEALPRLEEGGLQPS